MTQIEKSCLPATSATLNAPTVVTLLRIALIPLFVAVFYLPYEWAYAASALIFALGSMTDWLDGFLARKLRQESAFGAFLDPVADKLMVVSALIMLVERDGSLVLLIPALVIIGREIAISALREWMASLGLRGVVAVAYIGKLKTLAQMLALLLLLYRDPLLDVPVQNIGLALLYLAALLAVWSMGSYFHAAYRSADRKR